MAGPGETEALESKAERSLDDEEPPRKRESAFYRALDDFSDQ
jgi:hypothetical protein